jgi:hypothetical protein
VSHIGWVRDPTAHLAQVGRQLDRWAEFARLGEDAFRERVAADREAVPEPFRDRIGTVAADRRSAFAGLQMALSRDAV